MTTKTQLTPYNASDREIQSLVGKAMCALANKHSLENEPVVELMKQGHTMREIGEAIARHDAEAEATIRCIDILVKESIYEIQFYIWERIENEFGIEL